MDIFLSAPSEVLSTTKSCVLHVIDFNRLKKCANGGIAGFRKKINFDAFCLRI